MSKNSGQWALQNFCTGNHGACNSAGVCSGCNAATSHWKAAYQNYKDCHGNHLQISGNSATELSEAFAGVCPVVSIGKCTTSTSRLIISVKSTGPSTTHCGSMDGCKHGHTGCVYKIGCLNRSALNSLGASGLNRVWAVNHTTL